MAPRSSEEILAQRDAWLARKTRREAGEDIPILPPLRPGEVAPATTAMDVAEEPAVVEPQEVQVVEPEAVPEPEPIAAEPVAVPQRPAQPRTSAEILAQREAWMSRKAARAAGIAPPPAPKPEPTAQAAPAPKAAPVSKAAPAAAKAAPKEAPVPKIAPQPVAVAKKKQEAAPLPIDPDITRRELLNYAWLASIGLFTVETVALSLWFAYPNFLAGEFGGAFPIGPASSVVPEVNSDPVPYTDGKFWLVNVDDTSPDGSQERKGVLAIFKVCTHLGCLYEWVNVTTRFECPCHGSKFALTGDYLAGPARRSLDRFVIQALAPDGTVRTQTNANGDPLIVEPDDILVIDTGQRILGTADIIPA